MEQLEPLEPRLELATPKVVLQRLQRGCSTGTVATPYMSAIRLLLQALLRLHAADTCFGTDSTDQQHILLSRT